MKASKAERIRELTRRMPVDAKARRTARIVALRSLREAEDRKTQERLNGHFDFGK